MYETQQKLSHSQGNSRFSESWVSADGNSTPTQHRTELSLPVTSNLANNTNVDPGLYNEIAEFIPLLHTFIEGNTTSAFTRRGSVVCTKMPSRESLARKVTDPKGSNATQSIPGKNRKDQGNNNKDDNRAELVIIKGQIEDLQRKLSEKDELLKSAENSKVQLNFVNDKLEEMKRQIAEKESLLKSVQLQLSDVKIKLADKQAALEKSHWEAMTYNKKAAELQVELDSIQGVISSLDLLIEGLTKEKPDLYSDDLDVKPYELWKLPNIDDLDETEAQRMEEARKVYVATVAAAKEKRDEESVAAASSARLHLQSLVFRSEVPALI